MVADPVESCARCEPFLSGLDTERQRVDTGAVAPVLIALFDGRLRGCSGPAIDSAAALIASAWIDERSGIAGAFAATLNWLADPTRFAPDWVAGVNEFAASLRRVGDDVC